MQVLVLLNYYPKFHHHTTRSKSNNTRQLLIKYSNSPNQERYISCSDDDTFGDEFVEFERPFHNSSKSFKIVGSCNGLLCLSDRYSSYDYAVLWNPSIKRLVTLPVSAYFLTEVSGCLHFVFGFGFDHKSNDYKVVKIVCVLDDHGSYVMRRVEIYALSTDSWRSIGIGDLRYQFYCYHTLPAFVNGAAHWIVFDLRKERFLIVAFYMGDEVFSDIALPNYQTNSIVVRRNMFIKVLGESLAVISYKAVFDSAKIIQTLHVWVMEEYGVVESWTKRGIIIGKNGDVVLGSRKNGDVLMVQDGLWGMWELVSYDTQSQQIKHLGVHGNSFYVDTYMESLVALDVADAVWKSHVHPNSPDGSPTRK